MKQLQGFGSFVHERQRLVGLMVLWRMQTTLQCGSPQTSCRLVCRRVACFTELQDSCISELPPSQCLPSTPAWLALFWASCTRACLKLSKTSVWCDVGHLQNCCSSFLCHVCMCCSLYACMSTCCHAATAIGGTRMHTD